jgi:hypothetical protein
MAHYHRTAGPQELIARPGIIVMDRVVEVPVVQLAAEHVKRKASS